MTKQGLERYHVPLLIILLLALLGLAALWRWSGLSEWLDAERLQQGLAWIGAHPAAPLFGIGGFFIAAWLALPATLLMFAAALLFGPWQGSLYVIIGALLSALSSYELGRLLGQRALERLEHTRLHGLSQRLARGGLTAMLIIRLMPIAPFILINILIGASHIRFRDFFLATVLVLVPHTLAIAFFADRLRALLADPQPIYALYLALALGAVVGLIFFTRYLARRLKGSLRNDNNNDILDTP